MNEHEMPIKYEAGYPGKDVMRDRAKNIMDEEMKLSGVRKPAPSSFSSPEKTKMRYYKKGGSVKCSAGGALPVPKSPFDSKMGQNETAGMKKGGGVRFADKFGDPETMKKGGKVKKECGGGAMKMAMGGSGKIRHKEMTAAGKPINKKGSVRMK